MKKMNVADRLKAILEPKQGNIKARLFVTRDDGITVYDSVSDKSTTSVAALVSGLWQASEALMSLVHQGQDVMEFRLGFDTSEQGIFLLPFSLSSKRYFLGAIYEGCINPGQLKRQVAMLKEEFDLTFKDENQPQVAKKVLSRDTYLFQDISDEEIDRLFALGGN